MILIDESEAKSATGPGWFRWISSATTKRFRSQLFVLSTILKLSEPYNRKQNSRTLAPEQYIKDETKAL